VQFCVQNVFVLHPVCSVVCLPFISSCSGIFLESVVHCHMDLGGASLLKPKTGHVRVRTRDRDEAKAEHLRTVSQ
jgi:hypothetical protein